MNKIILEENKKINEILNAFLEPFECTASLDTDFAYYTNKNLITYAFFTPEKNSKSFLKFCENLFPNIHADIFLWSFMHELAHHETEDDIEDEEWEEYEEKITHNISDEEYYNLIPERAATVWAGEYIQSHVDEVAELWNELQPAIENFYSKLNVE